MRYGEVGLHPRVNRVPDDGFPLPERRELAPPMGPNAPDPTHRCKGVRVRAYLLYRFAMVARTNPTPYADLNDLMLDLLADWQRLLGTNLAGAYVQGSFALGAGDRHSDCDWLVTTHRPLTETQVEDLRALHNAIPRLGRPWCADLEGSYAPMVELATVEGLGRPWLFNDHGHATLVWDDHCNRGFTRWILREHGITLWGPPPRSFIPPVPDSVMRTEAAATLGSLLADVASWIDIDTVAWGQRYVVVTASRALYTRETGRVASKAGSLEWALRTLDRQWLPLLAQVRDERVLGYEADRAPRPGEAERSRAFVAYAVGLATDGAKS